MKKIKLAVVGCLGRMGKEIIKEINISPNCELVSAIEVKKTTIKISNRKRVNFQITFCLVTVGIPQLIASFLHPINEKGLLLNKSN